MAPGCGPGGRDSRSASLAALVVLLGPPGGDLRPSPVQLAAAAAFAEAGELAGAVSVSSPVDKRRSRHPLEESQLSKILFVVTGAQFWTLADGSKHPTGYWAEELVAPFQAFTKAGHEVVVATPGGDVPVVDEASLAAGANGGQENADAIKAALGAIAQLQAPLRLEDVDLGDYAAVFYPGGHGPMEDLAVNSDSARLLAAVLSSGKPLGVVCHAPAALLATQAADGSSPFAGYKVTSFTNDSLSPGALRARLTPTPGMCCVTIEPASARDLGRRATSGRTPS